MNTFLFQLIRKSKECLKNLLWRLVNNFKKSMYRQLRILKILCKRESLRYKLFYNTAMCFGVANVLLLSIRIRLYGTVPDHEEIIFNWQFSGLAFITYACLILGFMFYSKPYFARAYRSVFFRWVYKIAHAFFIVFAMAFSNIFVESALKLPPQDFFITFSFFALIFYIPVFLLGLACIFAVLMMATSVLIFWETIRTQTENIFRLFLINIKNRVADNKLNIFCHFGALLFIFATLNFGSSFVFENSNKMIPFARSYAYQFDYHTVDTQFYPCIKKSERIRLHENGLISVAIIKPNNFFCFNIDCVEIQIRDYEQCQILQKGKNISDQR